MVKADPVHTPPVDTPQSTHPDSTHLNSTSSTCSSHNTPDRVRDAIRDAVSGHRAPRR